MPHMGDYKRGGGMGRRRGRRMKVGQRVPPSVTSGTEPKSPPSADKRRNMRRRR